MGNYKTRSKASFSYHFFDEKNKPNIGINKANGQNNAEKNAVPNFPPVAHNTKMKAIIQPVK